MTVRNHTQSPDNSVTAAEGANVNNFRFEFGRETLAVVLLLTVIIGACGLVMGLNLSKQDRQDERYKELNTRYMLLERRLMDKEALDILHGRKIPSDTEFGPTGNMERMNKSGR